LNISYAGIVENNPHHFDKVVDIADCTLNLIKGNYDLIKYQPTNETLKSHNVQQNNDGYHKTD